MIPYGRQHIDEDDIQAVIDVLRSDRLTQGPAVIAFEQALADYCGAKYAVVMSNGTAALHAAYIAAGISKGDEFITSPLTFVATVTAGVFEGAVPVFVDIDEETGNIDAQEIEKKITKKTKAIVPIHYTGRPANLDAIISIAKKYNIPVVADACQALGASYNGKKIGNISDLATFSFHPVKSITTGEGGAVLTNNKKYYDTMKRFITHGVEKENFEYQKPGDWYFEMQTKGYNYRLTDIQAALGNSQLKKLDIFIEKRRKLAIRYHEVLKDIKHIILPPQDTKEIQSAWHLYVVRLSPNLVQHKPEIFAELIKRGIGVQVHHVPVHMHPFYHKRGHKNGDFPKVEKWYNAAISLPLFPDLTESEQDKVVENLKNICSHYANYN